MSAKNATITKDQAKEELLRIAKLLDKSYKSVDSALQRIRMKAKKVIEHKNEL